MLEETKPKGMRRAKTATWTQDPEGVRKNILDVATEEFNRNGFSGARVDEIAARTQTSKRMIYYYFGDKEGLYLAVLEAAYARIRSIEAQLDLARLPPVEALSRLTGFTFDYHAENPYFVRLVMVENIHHARHLKKSEKIGALNLSAIGAIREVYRRGVDDGAFRPGIDPMDIHLTISALSFYNVSNRASIAEVFRHDMGAPDVRAKRRECVVETVIRFVRA